MNQLNILKTSFWTKKNFFVLLVSLLASINIYSKIELIDRVVAVVDSGVIMESQLNSRVEEILIRLKSDTTELPPINLLEEQVLDRLIIEEIQLQLADRAGIKISDSELNQTLSRVSSQNNLSLDDFRLKLEAEGTSYKSFRDTIKKELIIQRVQRGRVGGKVDISEQEIENFINSEEGKSQLAEQYNVQHILLSVKSGSTEQQIEKIRNEANNLITRLEGDESFEKLAASYSSGQEALEGGFLGWRTSAELPSLFANVVTELKVGEVAQPLRSGAGFHILKLTDKRGNTVKFLDQTLARHILVQPSEIRTENQAEELINEIYERLTNGEDFKQLARQFSEDPGSKMDGGELGWSNPGDYDPVFEKTLNATEIGKISEPVQSSFGWHIIEAMDRRNEDVSQEEQKNRAYQIIFKRKFEQELQSTLIELRAEAYVDIKLTT
ncbi:peptidylprolyl isomerase [Gammaproteobacteria bacterium]|nr:peptidylprolyl isomerase [SAR86 cluster bacterium]MDB3994813.1 peptidylprolyl isomerase [Gammaproteobacteria bacterium]MDB4815962.1 peptidylprolyl isomerase [Gammaproteobacteria bacterium]|tara:strand:+ start:861 stop:2180 length:1320 start_codon:yes stop_codon:yes gene_type:complete